MNMKSKNNYKYSKINCIKSVSVLFLLIFFNLLFSINSVFAIEPESKKLYQGIDVSGWQGKINFEAVKESKIDIVYIKSSEGTRVDPYFYLNYNNALLNGLKIGVYHFVDSKNIQDVKSEALIFCNLIKDLKVDCKIAMDFESFGTLSKKEINDIAYEFLTVVKNELSKDIIIYSDLNNVINIWDEKISNEFDLWLAYYNDYNLIDNLNLNWDSWIGIQYTDEGTIPGIRDLVDRDYFTKEVFYDVGNINLDDNNSNNNEEGDIYVVDNKIQKEYVVRKGNTLSFIAKEFNTTVENIVLENDIQNPNLIYIGEKLKIIPNYNDLDKDSSLSKIYYKVKKGDTLYSISKRYDVTVEKLVRLNNIINPNLIFPNEILKIPN